MTVLAHQELVIGQAHLSETLNKFPKLALTFLRSDQLEHGGPADLFIAKREGFLSSIEDRAFLLGHMFVQIDDTLHAFVRLDLKFGVPDYDHGVASARILNLDKGRHTANDRPISHL